MRLWVVSSEFEGTINENGQDGVDKKVGGFFDDEVLPVNLAGSERGLRGKGENQNRPSDCWQPVLSLAADGHIP